MPTELWTAEGVVRRATLGDEWIWRRVRTATEKVASDLRSWGLRPIAAKGGEREIFVSAARHLASVPGLEAALASLVRNVTLLEAEPDYDVSHSEPRWPKTIFVSSPPPTTPFAALRLLENVVHEAMHLQLTKLEGKCPLVPEVTGRLFSPWKCEDRGIQGILHGVYVFTCISSLFAQPTLLEVVDRDGLIYAARRRSEIASELAGLDMKALAGGLNEDGRRFLDRLLVSKGPSPWARWPDWVSTATINTIGGSH